MNMQLVEFLLEEGGYEIVKAASGEEAMALARGGQPVDLILMDIPLPGVDGLSVVQALKEDARTVAARDGADGHGGAMDGGGRAGITALMREHAAAISCGNYWLNEQLAKAASDAGSHFCHLGGNTPVVDPELALDAAARAKGV